MNSLSHYTYGAVGQWMFENIGSIRMGAPGYKKVIIKPAIPDQLDWVKVSYDSPQGKIAVHWEKQGSKIKLKLEVPDGADPTVHVPGAEEPLGVKPASHVLVGSL